MADLEKIVETLGGLTILEAAELVKKLEDEWGVSAAAPASTATLPASGSDTVAQEKDEFDVFLAEFGANKIAVIKEVRGITGLGLKEAKELVESAPKSVKAGVPKEEAEKMKEVLEKAGAKVELK